ncbi:ciliary microtubule-associated protein 3-like [Littorina saxatilis]|uniref:Protein pitchfork n=1 Tax=Littorina saxatilis TaxID=31220 RepID=A0AAN9B6M1_9CAEN
MMDLEPKSAKLAFMSSMERDMFPIKMPYNRFGNEVLPLRGAPHRGPGCYNNEEKTNLLYQIESHLESRKGYTLGARTGPRLQKGSKFLTPAPSHYQRHHTGPRTFLTSNKPFEVGSDRFPVRRKEMMEVLPGPGTYEHEIPHNRQVQWHQSFGSSPIMMPPISIKSTIQKNTDKLYSTKEEQKFHRKLAYLKLYYD